MNRNPQTDGAKLLKPLRTHNNVAFIIMSRLRLRTAYSVVYAIGYVYASGRADTTISCPVSLSHYIPSNIVAAMDLPFGLRPKHQTQSEVLSSADVTVERDSCRDRRGQLHCGVFI